MEEYKNNSPFAMAMKWGLIGSISFIAIILIDHFRYDTSTFENIMAANKSILKILAHIPLFLAVIAAQINLKRNQEGGYITYGRSVGVGVLTGGVASIIVSIYSYLYHTVINPQVLMIMRQFQLEQYPSAEEAESAAKMLEMFTSPGFIAASSFFSYAFIAVILSIISSFFIRKDRLEGF